MTSAPTFVALGTALAMATAVLSWTTSVESWCAAEEQRMLQPVSQVSAPSDQLPRQPLTWRSLPPHLDPYL